MHSIRTQLILVFLLVILVPCALITYLMYTQSLSLLERNLGDSQISKLSKTSSLIDQSLSDMSLLLNQLADNADFIQTVASIQAGPDDRDARKAAAIMRNTQGFYNSRIETLYLYLYGSKQIVTSFANERIVQVRDPQYYDWISQYSLREGDLALTPWFLSRGVPSPSVSEMTGPSIIKKRLLLGADGQRLGELGMLISWQTLRSAYLDAIRNSANEIVLLFDEHQNLITTIGMDVPKFRALGQQDFFARVAPESMQGQFRIHAFGQVMQVCYARSRQNGFTYLSLVPASQYAGAMATVGMQGVLVALVAAIGAVFVSIWYSMRLSQPIRMLRDAMLKVGTGDLSVRADYRGTDDFTEITEGFNTMIRRVSQLMTDLSNEELLLKEAELRNLQAQINPHFLYNTLETMHWMASLNRTREVKELSMALANFYRATLSQGRKTVTVGESFDMIREYIAILTARYGERFTVSYDEPPALKGEQVLHLVLQPIVENAIQHSIERVAYHVNLFIGIAEQGEDLIITVHDDGAGIDDETLSRISASLDDEQTRPEGFALKNVHKRLRLMYGEAYGLTIDSQPGEYTKVCARMRKLDREAGSCTAC